MRYSIPKRDLGTISRPARFAQHFRVLNFKIHPAFRGYLIQNTLRDPYRIKTPFTPTDAVIILLPRPSMVPAIPRRRVGLYPRVLNRYAVPDALLLHSNAVQLAHLVALRLAFAKLQPLLRRQARPALGHPPRIPALRHRPLPGEFTCQFRDVRLEGGRGRHARRGECELGCMGGARRTGRA